VQELMAVSSSAVALVESKRIPRKTNPLGSKRQRDFKFADDFVAFNRAQTEEVDVVTT
jgi:hypothetical protein